MSMANMPGSRKSQRHCAIRAPETDVLDREVVGDLPGDGVGQAQVRALPRSVPIQNGNRQRHRNSLTDHAALPQMPCGNLGAIRLVATGIRTAVTE